MIGIVNIRGTIGDLSEITKKQTQFITLLDVVKQIESNKEALSFNVYIDSIGGFVEEGYRIFNYLKTLGKPVNTFIDGKCFSIATVIFLAGERRIIDTKSQFMIHAPLDDVTGNANELESVAQELREVESEMVGFYHKHTGISKAALSSLIESETFLTPEEAVSLGFATEIETTIKTIPLSTNIKAVAFSNKLNKKQMNDTLTKEETQGLFNKIGAQIDKILKRTKPLNIVLQDTNGVEINFPDVEEGQTPGVDSVGSIDGSPAEGSYVMDQLGATLVFIGGIVTEIIPNDDEATAALKTEIEQLKTQLTEKEGQLNTANTEQQETRTEVLGLKTELGKFKALAGKFEPGDKKKTPTKEDDKKSSGLMKAEFYDK